MNWLYFVATFLILGTVNGVKVNLCDDNIPPPNYVVVEGCDTPPCPLVKLTSANVNISFDIPHDVETSIFAVKAYTFGIWVDFPPPDNNVCHSLTNTYCPLEKGERVIYNLRLPVQKYYPQISLTLKITFFDAATQTPLTCFQLPCKVVNKKPIPKSNNNIL